MPWVCQKPIGGTTRSTRREDSRLGKLVLLKLSERGEADWIRDGSSFTLQINAPFNPILKIKK